MDPNFLALAAAALTPLVVGFIWYSPAVFGRVVSAGAAPRRPDVRLEENQDLLADMPGNAPARLWLRIILFILLGILLTVAVMPVTIHQMHIYSILAGQPQAEIDATMNPLMAKYGGVYRTFKHGAFHGTLSAIFMALPILGISAMAERKRGKVVLAHLGYWIITLALVGGIVCGYGFTAP